MRSFQSQSFRQGQSLKKVNLPKTNKTRWWSQVFFYVHPDFLGKWSNLTCAFFFRWVEKNHQPRQAIFWSFISRPLMNFSGREAWRFDVDFWKDEWSCIDTIQFTKIWWIGWLIGWLIDCLVDWLIDWLIDWLVNDLFHSVRQSFSQSTIDFVEPNQPVNQFVDVFISPVLLLHGLMLQQAFSEQFQDLSLK